MASLVGSNGSDTLAGTSGADVIDGIGGNDSLVGNGGPDTIRGGDGNDRILAGASSFDGSAGADSVAAGNGDDSVYASTDFAFLSGGDGRDYLELTGSGGRSLSLAVLGFEAVRAGSGNDTITAGGLTVKMTVYTGDGADNITGTAFDDWLFGETGNDTLVGADGDDWLDGGTGLDSIIAGNGNDTVSASTDFVSVAGGAGNDILRLTGSGGRSLTLSALVLKASSPATATTRSARPDLACAPKSMAEAATTESSARYSMT